MLYQLSYPARGLQRIIGAAARVHQKGIPATVGAAMTFEAHASAGRRPLLLLVTLTVLTAVTMLRLAFAPAGPRTLETPPALATAIAACAQAIAAVRCVPAFRARRKAPARRARSRPYTVTLGRFQT